MQALRVLILKALETDQPVGLTRQESAGVRPSETDFECMICLTEFEAGEPGGCQLRGCGHRWCEDCLKGHIHAAMDAGAATVHCPDMECDVDITQRELRAIIGTERFAQLDRRGLEQLVSIDSTLHLCQTPDCTYVISWSGDEPGVLPVLKCPLCSVERCLACGVSPYHTGNLCPEPGASGEAPTGLGDDLMSSMNIKPCPRCNTPLCKASGCDKMKCRCGYRFCWHCLTENAQCGCTPSNHGFIDNETGRGDFTDLRNTVSPT